MCSSFWSVICSAWHSVFLHCHSHRASELIFLQGQVNTLLANKLKCIKILQNVISSRTSRVKDLHTQTKISIAQGSEKIKAWMMVIPQRNSLERVHDYWSHLINGFCRLVQKCGQDNFSPYMVCPAVHKSAWCVHNFMTNSVMSDGIQWNVLDCLWVFFTFTYVSILQRINLYIVFLSFEWPSQISQDS